MPADWRALWETSGPARTSLLLSSHHALLPWFGMIAFALSIGLLEHGRQSLDAAALPGGAKRMGCASGRDRGRPAAVAVAGGLCPAGPGGDSKTRPAGQHGPRPGRQRPAVDRGPLRAAEPAGRSRAGARGRGDPGGRHEHRRRRGPCRLDPLDHRHQPGPARAERFRIGTGRAGSAVEPDDDHPGDLARAVAPCWLSSASGTGSRVGGVFSYVLETSAIIGPPAVVVFLVAFFWPTAHGRSAVATLVGGCLVGAALWFVVALGEAEVVPDVAQAGRDASGRDGPGKPRPAGAFHLRHSPEFPRALRPRCGLESGPCDFAAA